VLFGDRDATYLEWAWQLAEKGRGCTSPNPVVGAVIVRNDKVVGEGWHVGPGQDHAEVAAIKDAIARSTGTGDAPGLGFLEASREVCAGATMYVTLEPCCTQGRTPPCTAALIAAGFGRVAAGAIDPTPQVNGRGLELLRAAGMQVDLAEGALAHRMKRQNDGLRKVVATGLPFVTYKYAMTLDGRVATDSGDSCWISGPESRALVHQWRAWSDAVVVGAETARVDDPRLTAREVACGRQPLRAIVGGALTLRKESNLVGTLGECAVLLFCGPEVEEGRVGEIESWGVLVERVSRDTAGGLDLVEVCRKLAARDIQNVLLEGGPKLAGAWWAAGLIDKVAAFVCPKIVSGEAPRAPLLGAGAMAMDGATTLGELEVCQVGADTLVTGYIKGPF
jgi:diaminohydroxyphosphoribosylaminopyrimidine deaminase/5-amino-6-(5-phosphoribosylamino)uracil reductase